MSANCNCAICQDIRRVQDAIDKRDPDHLILILREFVDRWANADFDNDYYECIFNGSWPSSRRILSEALKRIETKTKERIQVRAHQVYINRVKRKLPGDQLSDWLIAESYVERGYDNYALGNLEEIPEQPLEVAEIDF